MVSNKRLYAHISNNQHNWTKLLERNIRIIVTELMWLQFEHKSHDERDTQKMRAETKTYILAISYTEIRTLIGINQMYCVTLFYSKSKYVFHTITLFSIRRTFFHIILIDELLLSKIYIIFLNSSIKLRPDIITFDCFN